jgi:hypothetical protein
MSINPAHIPINMDPDKTQGKTGSAGDLFGRLAAATGAGPGLAMADLALGGQFLSVLEGEMGKQSMAGAGLMGLGGLDTMNQSVMTQLLKAMQEVAAQQEQGAQQASAVDTGRAFTQALDKAAADAPDMAAQPAGKAQGAKEPLAMGRPESASPGMNAAKAAYGGQAAKSLAGFLSARFESGTDPGAIGYDRVGGTSYGSYQIASKTGTMDRFLDFLQDKAPDMAERLRSSGPANTGSKDGAMPDAWKALAAEDPDGFFGLQHDFIKKSHLEPAAKWISEQTGIDVLSRSPALAEVLFSTAVQHGPTGSTSIFARAVEKALGQTGLDFDKTLIRDVYKNRTGQFASSTDQVKSAVMSRLSREESAALALLGAGSLLDASV